MEQVEPQANKDEAEFTFDELFFSRTDSRGIIEAGNSVFQRISQYSWAELLKKPHNVIRHPDMPKGVFYLLWDFIKQGKPIGAYVKNRSKDGKYYWVFAVVSPIDGGFLSVRLKPSSDIFHTVEGAYKALLQYERDNKLTPKQSMEHLMTMLNGLGFDSYDAFMSVAIRKEVASRDEALNKESNPFLRRFNEMTSHVTDMMKEMEVINAAYEENKYVPMNLQIQSAQLGEEGKTIGVISGNFSVISAEIKDAMEGFIASANEVMDGTYSGQFLVTVASIQKEVAAFFKSESANSFVDNQKEMNLLESQLKEYEERAQRSLKEIERKISVFQEGCARMKKFAASLEVIRIMGKVDAARLHTRPSGLSELIDELGGFHGAISDSLSAIEQHNGSMKFGAEWVINYLNRIAKKSATC